MGTAAAAVGSVGEEAATFATRILYGPLWPADGRGRDGIEYRTSCWVDPAFAAADFGVILWVSSLSSSSSSLEMQITELGADVFGAVFDLSVGRWEGVTGSGGWFR